MRFKGDDERAAKVYENVHYIRPQDIADMVWWIFQTPAHVNINRVEVMLTAQSSSALNVYRHA